eukprot:scaffold104235_cov51-Phaeocystis_antarctica.AAC.1
MFLVAVLVERAPRRESRGARGSRGPVASGSAAASAPTPRRKGHPSARPTPRCPAPSLRQ